MRRSTKRWLVWLMMGGCLLQLEPARCVPTTNQFEDAVNTSIGSVVGGTISFVITAAADALLGSLFPVPAANTGA